MNALMVGKSSLVGEMTATCGTGNVTLLECFSRHGELRELGRKLLNTHRPVSLLTEVNELAGKHVQLENCWKTNKGLTFIDNTIMPPKPTFSIIKTRTKNKDVHPGEVMHKDDHGNPKQKHRSPAEMKEVHHQEELARKEAEQDSQYAIIEASLVEDRLREEDIARQTPPNRQLEAVPAFRPPPCTSQNKKTSRKDGIEGQADGVNVEQSISPDIADTFPARLGFSSLGHGPHLSH